MYRIWAFVRILIILAAVGALVGAVAFRISEDTYVDNMNLYNRQLTVVVGTAVANALNDATRTAEAPLSQYRLIRIAEAENLVDVAEKYQTSIEAIHMANGLSPSVQSGNGQEMIIPEGILAFDPPRRLTVYRARFGDTLFMLAQQNDVPLLVIEEDNPILANRNLLPGDIVFIATLL